MRVSSSVISIQHIFNFSWYLVLNRSAPPRFLKYRLSQRFVCSYFFSGLGYEQKLCSPSFPWSILPPDSPETLHLPLVPPRDNSVCITFTRSSVIKSCFSNISRLFLHAKQSLYKPFQQSPAEVGAVPLYPQRLEKPSCHLPIVNPPVDVLNSSVNKAMSFS